MAAAATLMVAAVVGYASLRGSPSLPGHALEDGMGANSVGAPVMLNDRVYFFTGRFKNVSDRPLVIRSIRALGNVEGVNLVDVRRYQGGDFKDGVPPAAWFSSQAGSFNDDPAKHPSKSLIGMKLSAGENPSPFPNLILAEFRAAKLGTWTCTGLEVEYEQAGLLFRQRLSVEYVVKVARTEAERRKYARWEEDSSQ
jgi:hypothetical protein